MTRVLIVDDQARARSSLNALLTAMRWNPSTSSELGDGRIETVGEASDVQAAIDQVELLRPDVVLVDLHPPTLDGATAIRMMKCRWPEVWIVVLTMYATDRTAALDAGADVFLLKGGSTGELLAALVPKDGVE